METSHRMVLPKVLATSANHHAAPKLLTGTIKSLHAFVYVYFINIAHLITTVALAKVLYKGTNYTVKELKIPNNKKRRKKSVSV